IADRDRHLNLLTAVVSLPFDFHLPGRNAIDFTQNDQWISWKYHGCERWRRFGAGEVFELDPNISGHWTGRIGEEIDRRDVDALSRHYEPTCASCLPREESQKTILTG